MFATEHSESLLRFGFKFGKGGAHGARTMILPELRRLFEFTSFDVSLAEYRTAVVDDNLLDKPTVNARKLTFGDLTEIYALTLDVRLF